VVIEREIFVAASPETVFCFLTDPALMADWIGVSRELDAGPGGLLRIQFSRGDIALGHYTEILLHRRVAFTWGWEPNHKWCDPNLTVLPPGASLVEINLESREGGHTRAFTSQSRPEGDRRTPQRALVSLSCATRGGGERT